MAQVDRAVRSYGKVRTFLTCVAGCHFGDQDEVGLIEETLGSAC
jgi:hypothetical protein